MRSKLSNPMNPKISCRCLWAIKHYKIYIHFTSLNKNKSCTEELTYAMYIICPHGKHHAYIHSRKRMKKKIRSPQRYVYVGDDDEKQRKKSDVKKKACMGVRKEGK